MSFNPYSVCLKQKWSYYGINAFYCVTSRQSRMYNVIYLRPASQVCLVSNWVDAFVHVQYTVQVLDFYCVVGNMNEMQNRRVQFFFATRTTSKALFVCKSSMESITSIKSIYCSSPSPTVVPHVLSCVYRLVIISLGFFYSWLALIDTTCRVHLL